jgi:hypothetical protein
MKIKLYLSYIILIFLLITPLSAKFYGLERVGIHGGFVFPENWGTGFNIGLSLDFGEMAKQVYFVPKLTYWHASKDSIEMSNLALAADLIYFPFVEREGVYVGTGISYNFLSWEYYYKSYAPIVTENLAQTEDTRIGFYPLVGYIYKINQIALIGELKYNLISDFDTIQLSVGAIIKLE